jgi:transposase InsO family protein
MVGHVQEMDEMGTDPAINALTHKSAEELTKEEVQERREFICTALKLNENKNLTPQEQESIIKIFLDNFDAVSISEHDFGKTDLLKFHIQVDKNVTPVRARCRPLNPRQEEDLRRQLDEWISQGIIEDSMSPWASALVPVAKQDGRIRWCCDFRSLNKHTVADSFPLPNIDANLHKLGKSKFYTALDSRGAFHNLEIDPDSRDYTTFTSPFGSFRWTRLPFGVRNGPAAYSRLVMLALQYLPPGFTLGYIDDILVFSMTMDEHIQHVRSVLELHVRFGMKLNIAKCTVASTSVHYLGHQVSSAGISMIDSYVDRVLEWQMPRNSEKLRSFLGFTGYYRSFIKQYASLTHRLNSHRNDKGEIQWTEEEKEDFRKLKEAFKSKPVRGFPDYDSEEPFVLDTDWSATNMAAILSQVQAGQERFLACVAKKCNAAEQNYASHKGELAACVLGLKKFEHILRAKKFVIRTDSRCVEHLFNIKDCRGMFARWLTFISSFEFDLVHRKGTKQCNADALSRMENLSPEVEADGLDLDIFKDIADIHQVRESAPQGITTSISLKEIAQGIALDPVLSRILTWITTGYQPNKEDRKTLTPEGLQYANELPFLTAVDGNLYHKLPRAKVRRLCLPETLWNQAFQSCHAHEACGHLGLNATLSKVRDRFYFPGLRSFVMRKIASCLPCLKKGKRMPTIKHQQYHEYTSYLGQRVCIDTVGPMNRVMHIGKQVNHILTMQDSFTRYLIATPVTDLEAKTLAKAVVDSWVMFLGTPEQIHTDRGTSFTSALFSEVLRLLGIKKTVTPPYCPRGDRVERAHRVLGEILRSDEGHETRDWAKKLPAATLAYNVAANRMTGVSPFEAVFGKKAVLPVDFVFPCDKGPTSSLAIFLETRRQQLSSATQQMLKTEAHSIQLDSRYRPKDLANPIKTGQLVYLFVTRLAPNITAKLQSPWTGPWRVTAVMSPSLAQVEPAGSWCKHSRSVTVTIDRLVQVDESTLSHQDLHPGAQLDLSEDQILQGDEVETEIVVPGLGIMSPSPDVSGTEIPVPQVTPSIDVKDEVVDDQPDNEQELPQVVIPDDLQDQFRTLHEDPANPESDTRPEGSLEGQVSEDFQASFPEPEVRDRRSAAQLADLRLHEMFQRKRK